MLDLTNKKITTALAKMKKYTSTNLPLSKGSTSVTINLWEDNDFQIKIKHVDEDDIIHCLTHHDFIHHENEFIYLKYKNISPERNERVE
jgi:hypothetical protein